MNENDQMTKLSEMLKQYDLNNFDGSSSEAGAFFFKTIQMLDVDLLLGEFQIAEEEKQIASIEGKINQFKEEFKFKNVNDKVTDVDCRGSRENKNQQDRKQHKCKEKNCQKNFQTEWNLQLHSKLMHNRADINWKENQVFTIQVTIPQEESQN